MYYYVHRIPLQICRDRSIGKFVVERGESLHAGIMYLLLKFMEYALLITCWKIPSPPPPSNIKKENNNKDVEKSLRIKNHIS